MSATRRFAILAVVVVAAWLPSGARAQGIQLERYEPTPAGAWFFGVQHPWYSSTRYFAAGLTLDYNHNALLGGNFDAAGNFQQASSIVEHQLVGHLDVAGSAFDRLQLSFSLPVVLLERGTPSFGIAPISGAAVGDPRFGVMVRLWGQPDRDPVSIHLGGYLWIPVGAQDNHTGEGTVRGAPQVVLAGLGIGHIRWAFNFGMLVRADTSLGFGPASHFGSELQLGAAIAYYDPRKHFQVGPELTFASFVTGNTAFKQNGTLLELMMGSQYSIYQQILIGFGFGSGLVGMLGSPDVRILFRAAYAPFRKPAKVAPKDSDGDGTADDIDACPREAGVRTATPRTNGCPDADKDGIVDAEDLCPNQGPGGHPDPNVKGCPVKDADGDGVPDAQDLCPGETAGGKPDPKRQGCAFKDSDNDGIADADDLCPGDQPGTHPDPKREGCPIPDKDGDGTADDIDACPDQVGIANADPKNNGCPKLEIKKGTATELRSVLFATNQAVLLPESFPILDAVAEILKKKKFEHIVIEGHADDTGTPAWNLRLSNQRARAVMEYLIKKGVKRGPLEYVGFGDTRPLATDRSDDARKHNRRVEVRIPDEK